MSVGITLEELLAWNDETARFWKDHLDAKPAMLELPCDIGGTTNVQLFIRHIWGVELRWTQRLAGLTPIDREMMPTGPLDAIFDMHLQALEIFRDLLSAPEQSWSEPFFLSAEQGSVSRRKVAAHALFHSQRHYAQLATLVRAAGFPTKFRGDLLFTSALG